ncbi:LysM peptidoglycan-binding domain-containing protein [Oenococcus sp.]|uniref:LysM peptidoglycan-binding domain-containing protein n=1 Tax=Oenococcus sp. TaxID=1979414 RepID=UPI0039E7E247
MTTKTVKNVLLVSTGAAAALAVGAVSANADTVTVKQGDSVWKLAQEYKTTTADIIKANGLENPNLILTGKTLNIPDSATPAAPAAAASAATSTAATSVSPKNADGTVTVAAGDTLYGIATRYNVSVSTLIANNNGSTFITSGQKLSLTAAPVSAAPAAKAPAAPAASQAPVSQAPASQAPAAPASAAAPAAKAPAAPAAPVAVKKAVTPSYSTAASTTNTYYYGQCTWYVKNMLSWVPNMLGNANQWASSAAAQGFRVDHSPAIGSVVVFQGGQAGASAAYGHVAVVTAVYGDSIRIKEGNAGGNAISTRTVASASSYQYIHAK